MQTLLAILYYLYYPFVMMCQDLDYGCSISQDGYIKTFISYFPAQTSFIINFGEIQNYFYGNNSKNIYWLILIFISFFIFDILKFFLFSKIKCKKKKLNPRFWLIYSKYVPIFSFFAPIYYALKLKKFTKKDFYIIIFSNIFYIFMLFFLHYEEKIWGGYLKVNSDYVNFDNIYLIGIIIFFILYSLELIVKGYLKLRKKIF